MVPRLSSSELCSVEFSALPLCDVEFCAMPLVAELTTALPCGAEFAAVGLPGFCAELCDAALLEDKFEIGDVELRDVAVTRELCNDEILEESLQQRIGLEKRRYFAPQ